MSTSDIAVLFATDPLKHTDKDIEAIIEKFRSAKSVFQTGAVAKKEKPASKKSISNVDLGLDLDLGDI